LFFGFWLIVSIFVEGCGSESTRERTAREQKARAEEQAEDDANRNEIINALKTAHNADDTWAQGIGMSTWTVDLQERLVGKPIVSSGILFDVSFGGDGKHYLHLIKWKILEPRFDFFLACSKPETLPTQTRSLRGRKFLAHK
jgi:hypothetical protein